MLPTSVEVKRLSIDCKATVNIGNYSRGGKTRGNNQVNDHDMGCTEKYIPFGIVDEDSGQLHIAFGSSYKTSDFIVDHLIHWWKTITPEQQQDTKLIIFPLLEKFLFKFLINADVFLRF